MVAEVELYWIIHGKCTSAPVDLREAQASLTCWKQEWNTLFSEHIPYCPTYLDAHDDRQISRGRNSCKWGITLRNCSHSASP